MKASTILFYLFLISFNTIDCQKQKTNIWKLKDSLTNDSLTNDKRIQILEDISAAYKTTNRDSALRYIDLAIDKATKRISTDSSIHSRYSLSVNYFRKAEILNHAEQKDTAFLYYQEALNLISGLNSTSMLFEITDRLALLSLEKNKTDEAINYYQQATKAAREINNYHKTVYSLNKTAKLLFQEKKYSLAYEYFEQGLKLYELKNDTVNISLTYLMLGKVNRELGNYNRSISFLNKSLAFYRLKEDLYKQKEVFEEISETYTQKKDYEKALNAFRMAMLITDSINAQTEKYKIENINKEVELLKKEITTRDAEISQIKSTIKKKYDTLTIRFLIYVIIGSLVLISFMLFLLKKGRKK